MGKPSFIWSRYPAGTTAEVGGSTPANVLTAVEHTGLDFAPYQRTIPGDTSTDISIDSGSGNTIVANSLIIYGEGLSDVVIELTYSDDMVNAISLHDELLTNGSFDVGTGWTIDGPWEIDGATYPNEAWVDGVSEFSSSISQQSLTNGKYYRSVFTPTGVMIGEIWPQCGTNQNLTGDGIHVTGSDPPAIPYESAMRCDGDGPFSFQASYAEFTIDNASLVQLQEAQSDNHLIFRFPLTETRGYIIRFWAISASAIINHICLGVEQDFPYLEEDHDPDNLDVDVDHLVSQAGYYCGSSVQSAMRAFPINFGSVIDEEYGPISKLAQEVIQQGAACFFVPDRDEDVVHFGWFDGNEFSAPLKDAMRQVKPLTFKTRAK